MMALQRSLLGSFANTQPVFFMSAAAACAHAPVSHALAGRDRCTQTKTDMLGTTPKRRVRLPSYPRT
jgi:hypothetical protein